VSTCPRCGARTAAAQEYCLHCGLRLPGRGRLGPPPLAPRRLWLPLLAAGVLATATAAAAIAATWEGSSSERVFTALGGSVAAPEQASGRLVTWPRKREAWTIVLLSLPKREGRELALQRARQARRRGLPEVGVLDSSRVTGLHPGYWVVFTGAYPSRPEATSELRRARGFARTASTRLVSG
jgi:hypothetical protein